MKLIRQSKLFFNEGNSDKVYEIDLCELSENEYLVNFRYGRRGSSLKEGTKTPAAVTREKATLIFSDLENEKKNKGYATEIETFIELPLLNIEKPTTAKEAILKRLEDAVAGTTSFKTNWKTSRVIWKAGAMQITESIPFIIKLATKGDEMQTYSALYALVQLKAEGALPLFNSCTSKKHYIKNIAFEGLLTILKDDELSRFAGKALTLLPDEMRFAIETSDTQLLEVCVAREENASHISTLYLISKVYTFITPVLSLALKTYPFKPPYFRQIRSVYKIAQVRKDANILAILSYRFEKEPQMFTRRMSLDAKRRRYVEAIGTSVNIGSELKSNESKLAYTQFTKTYFQKNTVDFIKTTGQHAGAKTYLKLAIATLLQYSESDHTKAEERPVPTYGRYNHKERMYYFTLHSYPECSSSLLLNTILFANDDKRKLQGDLKCILGKRIVKSSKYYYSPENVQPVATMPLASPDTRAKTQATNSLVDSLKSAFKNIFGKKSEEATQPQATNTLPPQAVIKKLEPPRLELYPEHWDAVPEAYVQLLMQARMNIIHRFAYNNLKARADFDSIGSRFDGNAILQLLCSRFDLPGQLGFELLDARRNEFESQQQFVGEVLNVNYVKAVEWAKDLVEKNTHYYIDDVSFTLSLIFNAKKENNKWISELLQKNNFAEERLQVLLGKTIAELLQLQNTDSNNALAINAVNRLKIIALPQMERINWNIVEQLMTSALEANKILAGTIIVCKNKKAAASEIPVSLVELFIANDVAEVRQSGIQLLNQYPESFLEENIQFILHLTDSAYADVVETALACIRKLIAYKPATGNTAIHHFAYTLIRKEKFEGAHAVINAFVQNDLKIFNNSGLSPKDITKLVQANYRQSQLTGFEILKTYDKQDAFSLAQIISFGSHELLAVRQWCWNYFKQNVPRIRHEKDKALNILDAKWDDTRAYAFHFFKTEFREEDWDADTLISIVDSIRPDVETFGKELITRYYKQENAVLYLTRLSEHPSVNVQAFVTHYLNLCAKDNTDIITQLDFYFRSVLTRVNKARVAKNRVLDFLRNEALQSIAAAKIITPIIDDMSAQSTVQDKAECIHILTEIKNKYPELSMHLEISKK